MPARAGGRAPVQVLATVGFLLLAIAAAVLLQRHHLAAAPTSKVSTRPTSSASAPPPPPLPVADLAAANLANGSALVTPFQLVASDGTAKMLIGAYADATRTVLFFRQPGANQSVGPAPGAAAAISIYDSHGFLNGGTTGGQGIAGDSFFALDLGPRLDQDGLAHLTVTNSFPQMPFTAPPPSAGWAFRFTLRVHATTVLPAPATFQLGAWQVTIESLAATPSVIDFQAVIAGANNEQLFNNVRSQPVTMLDTTGDEVRPITARAGVTVPKQQLNARTYQNTRVHYQWARPANAVTYRLRVSGNGATETITLQIPSP